MTTGNHEYNTPAEGALDWHIPLNENAERLDTDVEIRDADANKSDYEPKDGAKYLGTDTGTIYLGDGNSWNELGTVGSGGSSEWTVDADGNLTPKDGEPVSVDDAQINEQAKMGSEPFTIYVRSDGDDTNTGLTESEPLASVSEALSQIPRLGVRKGGDVQAWEYGVIIDVEAGATFTEPRLIHKFPWTPVEIRSSTEGAAATLEITNDGAYSFAVVNSNLRLVDIAVTPESSVSPDRVLFATQGAQIRMEGSAASISGATTETVFVNYGTVIELREGVIDGETGPSGSNRAVVGNQDAYVATGGGITIQNAGIGLVADDMVGSTMAGTVDNCGIGVKSQDLGRSKVTGTVQNCDTAFHPDRSGWILNNGATLSGNGQETTTDYKGTYNVI